MFFSGLLERLFGGEPSAFVMIVAILLAEETKRLKELRYYAGPRRVVELLKGQTGIIRYSRSSGCCFIG